VPVLRRILCLAAFLTSAVATAAFAAVCPLNQFTLGTIVIKSSQPVETQNSTGGGARYSIPVGVIQASARCTTPGCISNIGVYVEDLFTVTGLPPGTPVPLTAHFLLDILGGQSGPGQSSSSANIQDTNANIASISSPQTDHDLVLPVAATAGQPFQLRFEIQCSNVGPTTTPGGGAFSFTGLPPGTGIISCQGYLSGTPVATRTSSWGRLKILYR
jgi:hypothetical protein